MLSRCLAAGFAATATFISGFTGAAVGQPGAGATYRNELYGFALSYPERVLRRASGPERRHGVLLVSPDGRARLLASASTNTTGESVASYRAFILRTSYAKGRVTYQRRFPQGFVVSGYIGDRIFYERIHFTCTGRVIAGWQIVYPASQRATYDRLVEDFSRHYVPPPGSTETCRQAFESWNARGRRRG